MSDTSTIAIAAAAATLAVDVKAFRSAAVASENKSNSFARSLLAALVSGQSTVTLATSAIIHAFGNPKSPKTGKPVDSLSGLRAFTGGDAVRKSATDCFDIFDNIDADAPRIVNDVSVGEGAIRPMVVAYILNSEGASKSLRALREGVASALRSFAKADAEANGADNSDAADETAKETADATTSTPFDAADAIAKLTVWASTMSEDDAKGIVDALETLQNVWDNRINAFTAPLAMAA